MIGKLVSKAVRTVYDKKVVRLTIDFPYREMEVRDMDSEDMLAWLDNRVDEEVGLKIQALEDEDQNVLDEEKL